MEVGRKVNEHIFNQGFAQAEKDAKENPISDNAAMRRAAGISE
jgi:hypothetical protein